MAAFISFYGCQEEVIGPQYNEGAEVFSNAGRKIFLINEGNFGWGNASVSVYDPLRMEVEQRLFYSKNAVPPGDVAQNMVEINGAYFLIMNNSEKIFKIDSSTFNVVNEITGLAAPRDACECGGHIFVSHLYAPKLSVINTATLEVEQEVSLTSPGGHLHATGTHLFISQPAKTIQVIDCISLTTDTVLTLNSEPGRMVAGKMGNLWVLEKGSWNSPPALIQINPAALSLTAHFLTNTLLASHLSMTADSTGMWFFGGDGIYLFDFSLSTTSEAPIISTENKNVYGMDADPRNGDIYFSDALDYVQQSVIYRFSSAGAPIDTFYGGIMTNNFVPR